MGGFCFALTNALLRRWRDTPHEGRAVAMFAGGLAMAAPTRPLTTACARA